MRTEPNTAITPRCPLPFQRLIHGPSIMKLTPHTTDAQHIDRIRIMTQSHAELRIFSLRFAEFLLDSQTLSELSNDARSHAEIRVVYRSFA